MFAVKEPLFVMVPPRKLQKPFVELLDQFAAPPLAITKLRLSVCLAGLLPIGTLSVPPDAIVVVPLPLIVPALQLETSLSVKLDDPSIVPPANVNCWIAIS